jgi:hypothetical protein
VAARFPSCRSDAWRLMQSARWESYCQDEITRRWRAWCARA